jgi:Cu/Ag efflux protein CusF
MSISALLPGLKGGFSAFLGLSLGLCLSLLAGCNGSGGAASSDSGDVVIGLTDAEGDFLAYSVDVLSLTLTRADGTVVETLPLKARVDFAQYTEMTEFVTSATIPSGVYTRAQMRLDYSAADIQVEDANGHAVAASVRDVNGLPIATLDVSVRFDARRQLVIAPGIPAHLTLDFNLQASNHVDTTAATPVVTVEPFLVADVDPQSPKIHRVRGPLKSVDTAASTLRVAIRPFHRVLGEFGGLTVSTATDTAFEINGTAYQGAAGLAQLALQPFATATVAVGDLDVPSRRFVAREVYAGSSVPFGNSDAVSGSVIARSGDVLTLRGATLVRADGSFSLRDTVSVQLSPSTRITRQTRPAAGLTKDDISVGQRITALGALQGTTLDTTNGLVRMLVTSLSGTLNTAASGAVEMTLQSINGRRLSLYNFTGTGGTPANDADPMHYELATGALDVSTLTAGTPVRARGFVRPYGQAPADFEAETLINVTDKPGDLVVGWLPASGTPFAGTSANDLTLDLTGVGALHHVFRGGVATDLFALAGAARVQPADPLHGLYAIGYHGTIQVYTRFDAYRLALETDIAAGRRARALGAHGLFDDASNTMTANGMYTALQ